MSVQTSSNPVLRKELQKKLFGFAVLFLFCFSICLTLAPAVKSGNLSGNLNWKPWIGFFIWLGCFVFALYYTDRWSENYDPYLIPIMYLLIGWGNLTIWRLSPAFGIRQSVWLVAGTLALLLVIHSSRIMDVLSKYRYIWLTGCFLLMGTTLLPGILSSSEQPNLWLTIGTLSLQPSEPLKFFVVVFLSSFFSDRLESRSRTGAFTLPSLLVVLFAILLLLMQRDLGTACLFLMLYAFFLYALTQNKRSLTIAIVVLVAAGLIGFFKIDVIKLRIEAWVNPWADPTNRSYQIVQALIAQASGGFLGSGPGLGSPNLVPVAISDFIFSTIVEETGLIGGVAVVTLFLLLFSRAILAAKNADSPFSAFLAGGLGIAITLQALMIIGGNIRLIPLTGVTLPLMSYGGSSLLISMISLGIILHISGQTSKASMAIPIYDSFRKNIFPIFIGIFVAVLLIMPVWSILEKGTLVERGDNLRRSLNDTYVKRGSILDRHDRTINTTTGEKGAYQRTYAYPDLAGTVGYAHPRYGLAGIEAAYDNSLRGASGYPGITLWWTNLLSGQTPPGFDLRLSVDLDLQQIVDESLAQKTGAGVLLNASTGEIFAISSHPTFDPAAFDQNWNALVEDPATPLLNRAVNGQYPAGTTTALFLYGQALQNNLHLDNFDASPVSFEGNTIHCSANLSDSTTDLSQLLKYSCPQVSLDVARSLGKQGLYHAYKDLGWYQVPSLPLAENTIKPPAEVVNLKTAALGQENLAVTPVQMALAAAPISSEGTQPTPKIVISTQTLSGQWSIVATDETTKQVLSAETALTLQQLTVLENLPAWGVVGRGLTGADQWVTWFIGGTNRDWHGTPLVYVLVLETNDPAQALALGESTLSKILIQ